MVKYTQKCLETKLNAIKIDQTTSKCTIMLQTTGISQTKKHSS